MTLKKWINSLAGWIILNAAWYGTSVYGIVYKTHWAWNISMFLTWVVFVGTIFVVLGKWAGESVGQPLVLPARAVPYKVDWLTDTALTVLFVAFGHWFYAAMIVIHIVLYTYLYQTNSDPSTYPGQNVAS